MRRTRTNATTKDIVIAKNRSMTSIPLDCNCPCGERKFSNNNGELTCCCDCHARTRVALCPDGIAEPPECSGCPSYYGSRCGVQWNAPEPEAYTTECDD